MQTEEQKQHAIVKDSVFFRQINEMITKKIGNRKLTFGTAYETENICLSFGNFPPKVIESLTFQYVATNPEFEQKIINNYLNRQKDNLETNVVPMVKMAIDIFKPLLANVSSDLFKSGDTVEQLEEKPIETFIIGNFDITEFANEVKNLDGEDKKQMLEHFIEQFKSGELSKEGLSFAKQILS